MAAIAPDRVLCARCSRIITDWSVERDDFGLGWTFTVRCHGESETCEISDRDMTGATVVEAVAFRKQYAKPVLTPSA